MKRWSRPIWPGSSSWSRKGGDPAKVASVASFFVSRIDVAVDKLIEERLRQTDDGDEREALAGLRGKVAIANAKLAYQRYKRLFAGARWEKLRAKGARVQRLLWASTGTKNPAYSDVLYVEELIGPDTVNTMPPATMDAFRDHGKVRASLEENVVRGRARHGRARPVRHFDRRGDGEAGRGGRAALRRRVRQAARRSRAQARRSTRRCARRPELRRFRASSSTEVEASLEAWRHAGNVRRLWARDASLWTGQDEAKWLGWLDIVGEQQKQAGTP